MSFLGKRKWLVIHFKQFILRLKYLIIFLFKYKMLFSMFYHFLSSFFLLWSHFLHYDNPQNNICPVKFCFQVLMAKWALDKHTAVPSAGRKPMDTFTWTKVFFFTGEEEGSIACHRKLNNQFKHINQKSLPKIVLYNFKLNAFTTTLTCF